MISSLLQYCQSRLWRKLAVLEKSAALENGSKGNHLYNQEKIYLGLENQRYWGDCTLRQLMVLLTLFIVTSSAMFVDTL